MKSLFEKDTALGKFHALSGQSGNNILSTCVAMHLEDLEPKVRDWIAKNPGIEVNIVQVTDVWKGAVHIVRVEEMPA